mmetsp:Transcript_22089/g.24571  ORF Transcript_22089/g.24571 Transcript_22089/m.24571 type:complete len:104 (-) Transcript_22089:7-318(-)
MAEAKYAEFERRAAEAEKRIVALTARCDAYDKAPTPESKRTIPGGYQETVLAHFNEIRRHAVETECAKGQLMAENKALKSENDQLKYRIDILLASLDAVEAKR